MIIDLGEGGTAMAVAAPPDASGAALVAMIGLPPPKGTVVVNGTATELDGALAADLSEVLGANGLAGAVDRHGLTVITGGTDAGIFSILGRAMAGGSSALVGVAPRGLVTWPGGPAGDRVRLEPHHSHFVLVDGGGWGDETAALLALAGALGRSGPSVAVVCGGGPVTRSEALGHTRCGRPLVVVAGSGRVADELAGDDPPADAETAEILARARITVCPMSARGPALVEAVLAALGR